MKSPSYLLVWNKKSQELFQLSHQLLGWSNSKIWIVHLLSVKTWFTDTERTLHYSPIKGQDNVYPSIHCTKIVLHKIWSEVVGLCQKIARLEMFFSHFGVKIMYTHQYTVPKLSSTRYGVKLLVCVKK